MCPAPIVGGFYVHGVEDIILLNELDVTFKRLPELKKLVNLTFKDIVYFWVNLPDDYILTY